MDNYREEIVVKKNRTLNGIAYAILMVLMVLFALIAAMLLASLQSLNIATIIGFVVTGGLAFLIYWKKDVLRTEYEYTFTNGELDFARVLGNNKRKNLGSMRIRNVEACGYVSGSGFQRYVTMPGIRKDNWFLNRDGNLFFFYFAKDDKKRLIVIEPTEEMVKLIKMYCGRGVFQD